MKSVHCLKPHFYRFPSSLPSDWLPWWLWSFCLFSGKKGQAFAVPCEQGGTSSSFPLDVSRHDPQCSVVDGCGVQRTPVRLHRVGSVRTRGEWHSLLVER